MLCYPTDDKSFFLCFLVVFSLVLSGMGEKILLYLIKVNKCYLILVKKLLILFLCFTQCSQKFAFFALTTATLMESLLSTELKATNSLTQLLKPNGQLNYRLKRGSTYWCLSPGHVTFHFCGKNNVLTFRKNVLIYFLPDRVEKCLRYFGMVKLWLAV